MNKFSGIFFHWLPLAATAVGLAGLMYAAVQQNYRTSLNDPQIQMAESGARILASGGNPVDVVPPAPLFNAALDLAPFIAVYDSQGTPLEASAFIDTLPPKPPLGVFQYAKQHGENRVTWQPNATTRIALVVRAVPNSSGYFVAAGRNMREVETRIDNLTKMIGLGLALVLFASLVLEIFGDFVRRRSMKKQ